MRFLKFDNPMHSFNLIKSSPATSTIITARTSTSTSASTIISKDSQQPEPVTAQRPQGYFMGLSTTPHTPAELTQISSTYYQQDELRLLSDINASLVNPFEALATQQNVTLDDNDQKQSARCSLSLSIEPTRSQRSSQPVDDVVPIVREEQSPDPTDKWIIMSGDEKQPFKCGYEGCGRKYSHKAHLQTHFVTHTGDSKLRCYFGDCTGTVIYPNTRSLTRHIHASHTFERPFRCELCDRRFRCEHHLKYHMGHLHFIKKSSKQHRDFIKSSSAATTTNTVSTSMMTSGVSQPELVAGQRQQGSYVGISTTVHTPESTYIPASYPQDGLRFLSDDDLRFLSDIDVSEISTPHIDPFEAFATHQIITFEDPDLVQEQEQPDEFPLPFDELLQPFDDVEPMAKEDPDEVSLSILPSMNGRIRQALSGIVPEAVTTGIAGGPNLPCDQYSAKQIPDPTDKWIIVDKSQGRPYRCGYPGCDKSYLRKHYLLRHFVKHTGTSKFKCPHPECVGNEYFGDIALLKRHIATKHTLDNPFRCDRCNKQFMRKENLKHHREHVHSPKNEQKLPKRKKK